MLIRKVMTFLTLVPIHILACVSPGFALFYALDILVAKDLKSATKVVFGITLGNAFEIALSICGISILATLAKKYPAFFYFICACLLLYLGGKSIMGFFANNKKANKTMNSGKYILNGFIITLLNPKALLFWPLMLLPVVINYPVVLKIATGAYFVAETFIFIWLVVYLVNIFKNKMVNGLRYMQLFFGVAMLIFGIMVAIKAFA